MSITLQVDVRERQLAALLTERGVVFESTPLVVGDVQIMQDQCPLCIWERKTVADLLHSIKDSRYREQKERLVRAYPKAKVMYVVEGDWDSCVEMVKGAIINTMFRDDIKVFMVRNITSTANFIQDTLARISKDPGKYVGVEGGSGGSEYVYALAAPSRKRDMLDPHTFSIAALSLIPGVSKTIAKAIVDVHGNLRALCDVDLPTMSKMELPSGKRLGPKLAERITSYLLKN
jgi:ERCC4-type nuclease